MVQTSKSPRLRLLGINTYRGPSALFSGQNLRIRVQLLSHSFSCFEQLTTPWFAPDHPVCRLECTKSAPKSGTFHRVEQSLNDLPDTSLSTAGDIPVSTCANVDA